MANPIESLLKGILKSAFDKQAAAAIAGEVALEAQLEGKLDGYIKALADDAAQYAIAHGVASSTVVLVEATLIAEAKAAIAAYGPALLKDALSQGKAEIDALLS